MIGVICAVWTTMVAAFSYWALIKMRKHLAAWPGDNPAHLERRIEALEDDTKPAKCHCGQGLYKDRRGNCYPCSSPKCKYYGIERKDVP